MGGKYSRSDGESDGDNDNVSRDEKLVEKDEMEVEFNLKLDVCLLKV